MPRSTELTLQQFLSETWLVRLTPLQLPQVLLLAVQPLLECLDLVLHREVLLGHQIKGCDLAIVGFGILFIHQSFLLQFELDFGEAFEYPISELLMVDQDLILERTEHADDWDEIFVFQLIWIVQFDYVIELVLRHASCVVVNLAYQEHDFFQLVVLVDDPDEVGMRYFFEWACRASFVQSLPDVADLVDGLVFAAGDSEVHPVVHLLEDLVVLLVVDAADVHPDILVAHFLSWKSHEDLLELVLPESTAILL